MQQKTEIMCKGAFSWAQHILWGTQVPHPVCCGHTRADTRVPPEYPPILEQVPGYPQSRYPYSGRYLGTPRVYSHARSDTPQSIPTLEQVPGYSQRAYPYSCRYPGTPTVYTHTRAGTRVLLKYTRYTHTREGTRVPAEYILILGQVPGYPQSICPCSGRYPGTPPEYIPILGQVPEYSQSAYPYSCRYPGTPKVPILG